MLRYGSLINIKPSTFFIAVMTTSSFRGDENGEQSFLGIGGDFISLPRDFGNGHEDQSLEKAVYLSFRSLHKLLSPSSTHLKLRDAQVNKEKGISRSSFRLNSRVMTLTLDRPERHETKLSKPARISFRHLHKNDFSRTFCVFLESENVWSDRGCRLISTNADKSMCECDHLSVFGLIVRDDVLGGLSDLSGQVTVVNGQSLVTVDVIVCLVAAAILLVVLIILIQVGRFPINFLSMCSYI